MTPDCRADAAFALPPPAAANWIDHGAAPRRRSPRRALANAAPLAIAASFALTPFVLPIGWSDVAAHMAVGLGALAIGMVSWSEGVAPAGLVKLMAALAVWFGPDFGLAGFIVATAALGCVASLAALALPRESRGLLPAWPLALLAFWQIYPATSIGHAVAGVIPALL